MSSEVRCMFDGVLLSFVISFTREANSLKFLEENFVTHHSLGVHY